MNARQLMCLGAWVVMAGALHLAGCGDSLVDDCVDLCEKAQSCGHPSLDIGTCDEQCSRFDDLASEADCEDQFSEFVDCAVGAADPCHLELACAGETLAYYACADAYCEANETAPECRGFVCSYSGGGSGQTCTVSARCTGSPRFELECVDGVCTCKQDGADVSSVAFQEAFCVDDFDTSVMAAQSACGWSF